MAASVVGVDEVKSRDSTPAESGMLTQYLSMFLRLVIAVDMSATVRMAASEDPWRPQSGRNDLVDLC
ncbi:hypothetical protein CBOM_00252 [Ceraceosorus bombacis]|uniref:Uncharacterized protein n=1 Tax=Ceraceosorus bombacis TaxID=401625 RepID=A0A0P1A3H2_9BASI|nr:hypothetical protein CBOM_00252 [Ceraceosorus bombacis]